MLKKAAVEIALTFHKMESPFSASSMAGILDCPLSAD